MKFRQSIILVVIGIIVGAVAAYFALGPGGIAEGSRSTAGTFQTVTSQLDEGGDLYAYMTTDGLMNLAKTVADRIQTVIGDQISEPAARERTLHWVDLVRGLIRDTGLYRIRALGISSRSNAEGLHHTRMIVHRDPGATDDLIWNLWDPAPHPLAELELLPADTVLAQFGDFRPRVFWEWLQKHGESSNVPEFKQGVAMLAPMLKMQGLDIDEILKSFGGSAGLIVTMDPEKNIPLPMGKETIALPAPGIAIVLAVQNPSLYDFITSKLPGKKPASNDRPRLAALPFPPSPLFPSPTLACNDSYLVFAGARELALRILTPDPAKGLTTTRDFRRFSEDMPKSGNGFRYFSPRVGKMIRDIQTRALNNPELKSADRQSMKTLMDIFPADLSSFGITENMPTGFRFTINHRLALHHMALMPVMVMAGIATAVAIPNIVTAAQKNRSRATRATMGHLATAITAKIAQTGAAPADVEKTLDGWGNPLLYRRGPGGTDFALASAGKDGIFSGWEQRGFYSQKGPAGFAGDMIMINGAMVFGPVEK